VRDKDVVRFDCDEAKLKMEFTAEEFTDAVNAAYRKTRDQFRINGFRKGKAPRSIIEKHYGEGVFLRMPSTACSEITM
jgi:trigger factor